MNTKTLQNIKAIIWDFDGVLMNSNQIRDLGFREVLKEYAPEEVDQLMVFHQRNGGLSRYVKFRYFFEEIRQESINEEEVQYWANQFGLIMRQLLVRSELLIEETLDFVKKASKEIPMFIVSGSDQEELRYLCKNLGISEYFQRIHGSPTPKKEWVARIIAEENLDTAASILIGDSINDQEAAVVNGIHFMGYNNPELESSSTRIIDFHR